MDFSGILGGINACYLSPRSPIIIQRLSTVAKEVRWVYLGTKCLRGVVCDNPVLCTSGCHAQEECIGVVVYFL